MTFIPKKSSLLILTIAIVVLLNIPLTHGQTPDRIWVVKWNSNVDLLASGGPGGVKIYNKKLEELALLTSDFIHDIAWRPDGQTLASVEVGRTGAIVIKIWDLSNPASPQLEQTLTDTRGYVETIGVDWHPTENFIAVSGKGVKVWDLDTETPLLALDTEIVDLTALSYDVKWSPDGQHLAALVLDGVNVWDTEGQLVWHYREVVSKEIVWNPDNTIIAVISGRGTRLLNAANGHLITTLVGEYGLTAIEWAGQYVIGVSQQIDGERTEIYLWNVASEILEQTLSDDILASAIEWIPEQSRIIYLQGEGLQPNKTF